MNFPADELPGTVLSTRAQSALRKRISKRSRLPESATSAAPAPSMLRRAREHVALVSSFGRMRDRNALVPAKAARCRCGRRAVNR